MIKLFGHMFLCCKIIKIIMIILKMSIQPKNIHCFGKVEINFHSNGKVFENQLNSKSKNVKVMLYYDVCF